VKVDDRYTHKFCINHFLSINRCKLGSSMYLPRLSGKFNVLAICATLNYAQK